MHAFPFIYMREFVRIALKLRSIDGPSALDYCATIGMWEHLMTLEELTMLQRQGQSAIARYYDYTLFLI